MENRASKLKKPEERELGRGENYKEQLETELISLETKRWEWRAKAMEE